MSKFKINSITDKTGTSGPVIAGVSTNNSTGCMIIPAGPTEHRGGRGRGIFFGGDPADPGNMTLVEIASTGNGTSFGNLANNLANCKGCASSTRGLIMGGGTPSIQSGIQAVTISSTGGVFDFGDLTNAVRSQISGSSNAVRACTYGGHDGSSRTDHIEFVTIATLGNTKDFGNLSATRRTTNGTSSSTRGVISGGYEDPATVDTQDYILFSSTGDAYDFGNLHTARYAMTGAASNGHGGL